MAHGRDRLARAEILLEATLKDRLETRARAEERSFGDLVRELLTAAIEAREAGPGGVAKSRADRLIDLVEECRKEQHPRDLPRCRSRCDRQPAAAALLGVT
jgi:plasmid stability protein